MENQEHTEHHHKESFIRKYIFSEDHKMISKQFLGTAVIWAVIAMVMSMLFRLQLGYPGKSFPILEIFLGDCNFHCRVGLG